MEEKQENRYVFLFFYSLLGAIDAHGGLVNGAWRFLYNDGEGQDHGLSPLSPWYGERRYKEKGIRGIHDRCRLLFLGGIRIGDPVYIVGKGVREGWIP